MLKYALSDRDFHVEIKFLSMELENTWEDNRNFT